ncbi:MAG: isochorismatase family protein [Lentisphaerae bacterium]|jgi:nicotinamidase-related amidase|nr:isochorismatase family protein [Lentisphaerota bacterium]
MFQTENSLLVIVDVQEKLFDVMHDKDRFLSSICQLAKVAQILALPVLVAEQYPEKLGPTVEPLELILSESPTLFSKIAKRTFSCLEDQAFRETLELSRRKQILLAGIESHICVFQTAARLLCAGFEVQVLSDAVSSRTLFNKEIGLARCARLGADLTSVESAAFEMLKTSTAPQFRQISAIIK